MKGSRWPDEGITSTDESATATHSLEQAQSAHDKTSQDLSAILFYLLTEKPAQLLVLKHEDETAIGGTGQKAWRALQFLNITDYVIHAKLAELTATSMKPGKKQTTTSWKPSSNAMR